VVCQEKKDGITCTKTKTHCTGTTMEKSNATGYLVIGTIRRMEMCMCSHVSWLASMSYHYRGCGLVSINGSGRNVHTTYGRKYDKELVETEDEIMPTFGVERVM
jgi:hypothetical protein